jgi:hypothetical protein
MAQLKTVGTPKMRFDTRQILSISIRIVNKRNYNNPGIYAGRPSPLGNPFVIGRDGDREEVMRKSRDFSKTAIHNGAEIKTELERLEELNKKGDVILICWCALSKCHGGRSVEGMLQGDDRERRQGDEDKRGCNYHADASRGEDI